jgi:hypothetical protein
VLGIQYGDQLVSNIETDEQLFMNQAAAEKLELIIKTKVEKPRIGTGDPNLLNGTIEVIRLMDLHLLFSRK